MARGADSSTIDRIDPHVKYSATLFAHNAAIARSNKSFFYDFVLYDDSNDHIIPGDLHYIWEDFIQYTWSQGYHAAILAPVRHGKTTRLVLGEGLWLVGQNLNARILVVSSYEQEAAKRVEACKRYIELSKEYRAVFPHVLPGDKWTDTRFIVQRTSFGMNPTMESHGVLSGPPGAGADLVIFDDITDFKNTLLQPSVREKVFEAVTALWLKRLDRLEAKALLVGIAWHEDDALHKLMRRGGFRFLIQRVSKDFRSMDYEIVGPS